MARAAGVMRRVMSDGGTDGSSAVTSLGNLLERCSRPVHRISPLERSYADSRGCPGSSPGLDSDSRPWCQDTHRRTVKP